MTRYLRWTPAAWIVGLAVSGAAPGCAAAPGPTERHEASEATSHATEADTPVAHMCASPSNGGTYCVPSTQGAAAAWNAAAAKGSAPIQMWAEWPANVTLDQLVSSTALLNAWLADVDAVVAQVRDVKKSAESTKATLGGKLKTLFDQAAAEQKKLLAQPTIDPIGKFKATLNAKAAAEKDPLLAQVAAEKQEIEAIQSIFDVAKTKLAPMQAQYAAIAPKFAAYRATEAAEASRFATLAQSASGTTLDTIFDVEQQVLTAAREVSTAPGDLQLGIMQTSAQLEALALELTRSLAPHSDFMVAHATPVPDMTSGALRSLNAMLAYVQTRSTRNDAVANNLLDGIGLRRAALTAQATDLATRTTIAQTQLLKSSTTFNDQATASIAALWAAPQTSTKLKLPYLGARYDRFVTFLQQQPLCDAATSAWRETGCIALRRNFNTAQSYLKTTIPSLLKLGVAAMRSKGVDPALLNAVTIKLAAGDVKSATIAYDLAVQASEGT